MRRNGIPCLQATLVPVPRDALVQSGGAHSWCTMTGAVKSWEITNTTYKCTLVAVNATRRGGGAISYQPRQW